MNDPFLGYDINTRTISAFPLSIGTSLAFESLFDPKLDPYDPSRQIPERIDISKYQEIWINISTLFRNIVGAIDKSAVGKILPREYKSAIDFEIDVINNLFQIEGKGLCKPIYYFCDYKDIEAKLSIKGVTFRKDKTDNQKLYKQHLTETVKLISKSTDEIIITDHELKPKQRVSALIMTHVPYDLLSYTNFSKLDLLESHTGKLKPRYEWNTKYAPVGENDMNMLPFLRRLYLIFGDKILIHPSDYKLRKLILDIAHKRQWTPMTTEAKIIQDFEIEIKEPFVLQFIKKL